MMLRNRRLWVRMLAVGIALLFSASDVMARGAGGGGGGKKPAARSGGGPPASSRRKA